MARRSSSLGGLRPLALALAVVVATSLLALVGISAQAAEEDVLTEAAPTSDPVVPTPVPDPNATAPDPAPVASQPPTPSTVASPPPSPPPTSVTVSTATSSASKSVSIVDFAFQPGSLTVNAGDTVQWTNKDAAPEGHDVTGDGLDSGLLESGDTYSHTFSATGSFSYICSIHPSMKGTVKVLARSGGSGSSGESGGGSLGSDATAAGSESAAVSSPGAAGTASSLPASGDDTLPLATLGLWLLGLGLGIRVFAATLLRRRS